MKCKNCKIIIKNICASMYLDQIEARLSSAYINTLKEGREMSVWVKTRDWDWRMREKESQCERESVG